LPVAVQQGRMTGRSATLRHLRIVREAMAADASV
jgi:hypothetical protein